MGGVLRLIPRVIFGRVGGWGGVRLVRWWWLVLWHRLCAARCRAVVSSPLVQVLFLRQRCACGCCVLLQLEATGPGLALVGIRLGGFAQFLNKLLAEAILLHVFTATLRLTNLLRRPVFGTLQNVKCHCATVVITILQSQSPLYSSYRCHSLIKPPF